MKTYSTLLTAVLALGLGTQAVSAQNKANKSYPQGFIGLQGGASWTFYNNTNDVAPIGAFQVGGYMNPYVGLRGKVYGWKNKVNHDQLQQQLEYKNISTSLDVLVNLSNIIAPEHQVPLDFVLFAGGAMDFNKAKATPYDNGNIMWQGTRKNAALHLNAGAQLDWKLSKHFNLNLEVGSHYLGDRMDSYNKALGDWQVTTMLGVTYKFKTETKHKSSVSSVNAMQNYNYNQNAEMANAQQPKAEAKPTPAPQPKPVPAPQPKPQPKPVAKQVVKAETTSQEVFFTIGSSSVRSAEMNKVEALAQWLNEHPEANVTVVGYADAGTGSASVNMYVAKKRANSFAKLLNQKYKISNDRITVEAKGDTEQPFSENDKNRVVIAVAK